LAKNYTCLRTFPSEFMSLRSDQFMGTPNPVEDETFTRFRDELGGQLINRAWNLGSAHSDQLFRSGRGAEWW